MEFVKVIKGTTETSINRKQLKHYIDNGWDEVAVKPTPIPKTYDKYSKRQLVAVARNRDIGVKSTDNKIDIVKRLVFEDGKNDVINNNSRNLGFTDNLIIE